MLCVFLSTKGVSYSLNIATVAVVCYSVLVLSLPILTPVVETLGKNVTRNIWQFASEDSAPRRPTLYPFNKDLLLILSEEEKMNEKERVDIERDGVGRNL